MFDQRKVRVLDGETEQGTTIDKLGHQLFSLPQCNHQKNESCIQGPPFIVCLFMHMVCIKNTKRPVYSVFHILQYKFSRINIVIVNVRILWGCLIIQCAGNTLLYLFLYCLKTIQVKIIRDASYHIVQTLPHFTLFYIR
ncbi:hypothetical protein CHS0354_014346 [Potamilus streckersoni]|uniref:Uncharacterized protein n=1 Tax=Potamilus streckersoni TaxID=2493646 RepID=A0AAE0VX36_9BIVA|nr:hypothetical protein CHS0354_014346 [Potamilus streckersoni]